MRHVCAVFSGSLQTCVLGAVLAVRGLSRENRVSRGRDARRSWGLLGGHGGDHRRLGFALEGHAWGGIEAILSCFCAQGTH